MSYTIIEHKIQKIILKKYLKIYYLIRNKKSTKYTQEKEFLLSKNEFCNLHFTKNVMKIHLQKKKNLLLSRLPLSQLALIESHQFGINRRRIWIFFYISQNIFLLAWYSDPISRHGSDRERNWMSLSFIGSCYLHTAPDPSLIKSPGKWVSVMFEEKRLIGRGGRDEVWVLDC